MSVNGERLNVHSISRNTKRNERTNFILVGAFCGGVKKWLRTYLKWEHILGDVADIEHCTSVQMCLEQTKKKAKKNKQKQYSYTDGHRNVWLLYERKSEIHIRLVVQYYYISNYVYICVYNWHFTLYVCVTSYTYVENVSLFQSTQKWI